MRAVPARRNQPCHRADPNAVWLEIILAATDFVALISLIGFTDRPNSPRMSGVLAEDGDDGAQYRALGSPGPTAFCNGPALANSADGMQRAISWLQQPTRAAPQGGSPGVQLQDALPLVGRVFGGWSVSGRVRVKGPDGNAWTVRRRWFPWQPALLLKKVLAEHPRRRQAVRNDRCGAK